MTKNPSESSLRVKFDAASRAHFSLFLQRVMGSVSPNVKLSHNWHMEAIAEYMAALCEWAGDAAGD